MFFGEQDAHYIPSLKGRNPFAGYLLHTLGEQCNFAGMMCEDNNKDVTMKYLPLYENDAFIRLLMSAI